MLVCICFRACNNLTRYYLFGFTTQVQLDDDGYVVTGPSARSSFSDGLYPYSTMTSTPGVFACGDLVDKHYRCVVDQILHSFIFVCKINYKNTML